MGWVREIGAVVVGSESQIKTNEKSQKEGVQKKSFPFFFFDEMQFFAKTINKSNAVFINLFMAVGVS